MVTTFKMETLNIILRRRRSWEFIALTMLQVILKLTGNSGKKLHLVKLEKMFLEKPIVAFTNSTVFILDFYIYITKPVIYIIFGLEPLDFEESS